MMFEICFPIQWKSLDENVVMIGKENNVFGREKQWKNTQDTSHAMQTCILNAQKIRCKIKNE